MSKRIKGITIELGASTTGLDKALQGVEKQSRDINKELADVNKLLKFNPNDTELLAQKQKLLGDQVATTRDKLNQLKAAEEQVQKQFESGEIAEEQYRAFQREVVETESKLKHYEGQLKEVTDAQKKTGLSAQEVGDKMQKAGSKMFDAGKNMSKYVTTPLVGVAAAATAAFVQVDESLDGIATATGATGDQLKGLHNTFKAVVSDMPVDLDTVSDAVGELNTQFGTTGKVLEEQTRLTAQFSEITGQDVVSSVQGAKKAMEIFNLEVDDYGSILNVVAKQAQDTGVETTKLWDNIQKGGPSLRGMGLSLEESVVLLAQMEQGGVDSSKTMALLGRAQATLAKDGKTLSDGLKEFQDVVAGSTDETDKMAKAAELFGSRGAVIMLDAVQRGVIDFDGLADAAATASGTVTRTFEETLDPIDQHKVALNNAKLAGAELSESLQIALAPAMEGITDVLKGVASGFSEMDDDTKQLIVKAGLVVAAAGPVLSIGGKLIEGAGKLTSGIGKVIENAGKGAGALSNLGPAAAGGVAAAGIGAVLAVTGLLIKDLWANTEAVKSLIDATKDSAASFDKSATEIETNAIFVEKLRVRLQELEKQAYRTNAEQSEMESIIKELNGQFPDLNLAIDEETGLLNKSEQAMQNYIDTHTKKLELEAIDERRKELIKEEIELQGKLASAHETLENSSPLWDQRKMRKAYNDIIDIEKALRANADGVDYLSSKQKELTGSAKDMSAETEYAHKLMRATYGDTETAAEELAETVTGAQKHITESDEEFAERIEEQSKRRNEILEREKQAREEFHQAVEAGTRDNLSAMAGFSKEKLDLQTTTTRQFMDQLIAEQVAFNNYHSNLKMIAAKVGPDVAAELEKLGPEAAPMIEKFVNGTDEDLAELAVIFRSRTEDANRIAREKAAELSGYKYGADWIQGIINGMEGKRQSLINVVNSVTREIPDRTRNYLMMKSPSKIGVKIGEDWDDSLAIGMDKARKSVGRSAEGVADVIVDSTQLPNVIPFDAALRPASGSMAASALERVTNNSYSTGDIVIQNMSVRNDSDITMIAQKLYNLQNNRSRSRGRSLA